MYPMCAPRMFFTSRSEWSNWSQFALSVKWRKQYLESWRNPLLPVYNQSAIYAYSVVVEPLLNKVENLCMF
ncbi:hypothetical protein OESDEN_09148 [Oesophagostomum dentatum]|uniref:Uncharacterized protein n=1 Tax=Oesophagostomum dentatum TaxID=61180 RepID=A0A0B1T166_OESDE|nr:hypothetical protein OESDEN_09148 [Oesophagostomum dentatum]